MCVGVDRYQGRGGGLSRYMVTTSTSRCSASSLGYSHLVIDGRRCRHLTSLQCLAPCERLQEVPTANDLTEGHALLRWRGCSRSVWTHVVFPSDRRRKLSPSLGCFQHLLTTLEPFTDFEALNLPEASTLSLAGIA